MVENSNTVCEALYIIEALFMLLSINFAVFGEYENLYTNSVLFAADQ